MEPAIDYAFVDADNHYYETRDAFTRYLEPTLRDRAIHVRVDDDGVERVYVGGRRFTFLEHRNFDTVVPPGALRQMLRALKAGSADIRGTDVEEPMQPEYVRRDARIAQMDRQGLESAFLFPTLAVCVEAFMMDDVEQLYGNFHAFNRWLDDEWGFNRDGRIHAPPLLSLADVDRACAELDWVLERGARIISLRPGPAYGRSPADPTFDPFWARMNEARATVGFHIGESSYNELLSVHWGEEPNPPSHRQSALQWTCFYGDRPIMDTVAALVYHNLFGRFPNIRVLSVENGSLWVDYLLAAMDKMYGMARNGPWPGGRLNERPSEIFKRHVFVSPYHEDPIERLVERIGPSQVVFGSDWPHAEGLAEPAAFADALSNLSYDDVRAVMRENARRLVSP